ncbi:MAG: cupredoxin domain-containing protein [Solirubrobacteraceae bacterium]|nr:cupredoxin domain-containing protein [Solirubrobacteraceae bacterium]
MPRRPVLMFVLAVVAATLPGCGEEPTRAQDGHLRVTLDEYRILPQKVTVPAGEVRITARNTGRLNHNLRVELPRQDPATPERTVGGTPTAGPHKTVSGTVRLSPGTYRLACTISNHDDLGMWGELTVTKR